MTTVKVNFRAPDGSVTTVDADDGVSLMEAALKNGIAGISADCGGACSCATCHVYFDQRWFEQLTPMADDEEAMMESVDEPHPTSRLSCQIRLSVALDGIEVLVPEEA